MIKVWIVDENKISHRLNQIDWKWSDAAGWDDVYDGQYIKGWDKNNKVVYGIAKVNPSRPPSSRPRSW